MKSCYKYIITITTGGKIGKKIAEKAEEKPVSYMVYKREVFIVSNKN